MPEISLFYGIRVTMYAELGICQGHETIEQN